MGRISNVVFMGMGEPLANFKSRRPRRAHAQRPVGHGHQRPQASRLDRRPARAIERLATELDLPVTLALSLHAPTDELRRAAHPLGRVHATIEQLLAACRAWFEKTGREITLEYILLGGVNDRPEHAASFALISRPRHARQHQPHPLQRGRGAGVPAPAHRGRPRLPGHPDAMRRSPPTSAPAAGATSPPPAASSATKLVHTGHSLGRSHGSACSTKGMAARSDRADASHAAPDRAEDARARDPIWSSPARSQDRASVGQRYDSFKSAS